VTANGLSSFMAEIDRPPDNSVAMLDRGSSRQAVSLASEVLSRQIQPLLANIQTSSIRSRIGVSPWYAGRIREGYRPHQRHWQTLAALAGIGPGIL
jgi:hypothetical protein